MKEAEIKREDVEVTPGKGEKKKATGDAPMRPEEEGVDEAVAEYEAATDENLVNFARNVMGGVFKNPRTQNYAMGKVLEAEATDIKRLTGIDVSDYSHNIKGNAVEHINKRHGESGNADKSMVDINDLGRVKYVINNYDSVGLLRNQNDNFEYSSEFKDSDGRPAPMIRYEKRLNGTYYVVEAVPDSKAKKLQVVSAYKKNAKKNGQVLNMAAKAPQFTSKPPLAATYNIPQSSEKVNTEDKKFSAATETPPPRPADTGILGFEPGLKGEAER